MGYVVAQLVEALRYKPEGRGFDSRWCHNPSGRTMALGLTQPLTEISARNISWWVKFAGVLGWQSCHLNVLIILKSGSLNLLEPSGPVKVCNGLLPPVQEKTRLLYAAAAASDVTHLWLAYGTARRLGILDVDWRKRKHILLCGVVNLSELAPYPPSPFQLPFIPVFPWSVLLTRDSKRAVSKPLKMSVENWF